MRSKYAVNFQCRRTLHIDFRSDSSSGLIFVLADYDAGDIICAFLHHGHVTFARLCSNGQAFETYHQRFDDMSWHSVCTSLTVAVFVYIRQRFVCFISVMKYGNGTSEYRIKPNFV